MTNLPHLIYGTCTKADTTAYLKRVWITNENENDTISVVCNSSGQFIIDLANMNDYSNGDILTVAIEAYGSPGYLLKQDSFEDDSVETIEAAGRRLNTATLTMNFTVGFGVSLNKARVEVFQKIWNMLNIDPPTYTNKSGTISTYAIISSFPEKTPIFPSLVVNPIVQNTMKLGVGRRSNRSLSCFIEFDLYAKTADGRNAIDEAKGKVQTVLENNWVTESLTVDTSTGGQTQDLVGVE